MTDSIIALEMFSGFSESDRRQISLAADFNNARFVGSDRPLQEHVYGKSREIATSFVDSWSEGTVTVDNVRHETIKFNNVLLDTPGLTPFQRSIILNRWLANKGYCPLIRYAFDQWYEIDADINSSTEYFETIAEISVTYLYRLVATQYTHPSSDIVGEGAFCVVFLDQEHDMVLKIPKNFAGFQFGNREEYIVFTRLQNTQLAKFVPSKFEFDSRNGVLRRSYVEGETGTRILDRINVADDLPELKQIREIYDLCNVLLESEGLNLDIHPGNFVWSEAEQRWSLVDLGPMPKIGATYFSRQSFEKYIQKIWLNRKTLMKEVPVRSVDLEVPKHFFVS